jgi:hypothetical protein
MPLPSPDQPDDDLTDLAGRDSGLVVIGAQAHRIQHRGPGGTARLQHRDHRVRPARDHLRLALRAAVNMAEQPLRAGGRVRPQPVAHIHRQHQPPASGPRQRQLRQRPAQPPDLDPAVVHRVIQRPMTAPVLRRQRQARQRPDRPVRAQHRLGQLEQRICPRVQAPVERLPEPGQLAERTGLRGVTHLDHRSSNRDHFPGQEARSPMARCQDQPELRRTALQALPGSPPRSSASRQLPGNRSSRGRQCAPACG